MSEWSETTSKNLEIQVSEGQLLKNYHFVQLTELTDECIKRIADTVINNLKTQDKVGRWVDDNCSECGLYVYPGDVRNYCPRCGTRMVGEYYTEE